MTIPQVSPLISWRPEVRDGAALARGKTSTIPDSHEFFSRQKDIEPGEEVYIDYGDEWQSAFDKHVQTWKPPRRAEKYRPAEELNKDANHIVRILHEEQYLDVNVFCHRWFRHVQGHRLDDVQDASIQADYCRAASRHKGANGETLYTAEVYSFVTSTDECYEQLIGVLFDLPREAFMFVDLLYSRDIHQPWAFRHAMGIPDEIMPEIWKNLKLKKL